MNQYWKIESNCESVRLQSETFQTEERYDILNINGESFTGRVSIDKILPNMFDIHFTSDGTVNAAGFKLTWDCHQTF